MRPEDLALLTTAADPQIEPGGRRVAFVVTGIDLEEDVYRRSVHLHDGETVAAFTAGPVDSFPRWAPDGRRLAFLRATDPKKPVPQVAVMPSGGGEARVISSFPLGVEYLAWSPDGRWICAVAKSWLPHLAELSDEERGRVAKRITRFPYRFDNRGWLHDRRRQLWLLDPGSDEPPRRLTEGDFDESMPAWHPNGERIAYITDRTPRQGLDAGFDVYEVTLEGALSPAAPRGGWIAPVYSPEGALHLLGDPHTDYPRVAGLWSGGEEPRQMLPGLDRSLFSLGAGVLLPQWRQGALYTVVEDSGRVGVSRFAEDGAGEIVVGGDRIVTGFDVDRHGRVVASVSTTTEPGEVVSVEGGDEQRLTFLAPKSGLVVKPTEHFRAHSSAGELDVWVVLPDGDGPFPVLLNIHGGPATQNGFGFFDEFQVYAAAGYAVVAANPRGSSGRGLEFTRAVVGEGWGEIDLSDITAALEAALDRYPQLNRERMGIMGGSYGGFMTAWAIAHDHRFRSAVVERALLSFNSFSGTSDIGPFFGPNYLQTTEREVAWQKSPLSVADRIRTPTLVLHSEEDYRCPVEQAEQFLMVLWQNGVEAEMIRFPGEGHELSRSGKPRHRVERFEAILDWHARHLSGDSQQPVDSGQ
ncbi:MAG TPA: S9 family peptidase [Acidimicrobiia bacterium]|nr:S9 family peptidase [Acidimicrobiia bacterium]